MANATRWRGLKGLYAGLPKGTRILLQKKMKHTEIIEPPHSTHRKPTKSKVPKPLPVPDEEENE